MTGRGAVRALDDESDEPVLVAVANTAGRAGGEGHERQKYWGDRSRRRREAVAPKQPFVLPAGNLWFFQWASSTTQKYVPLMNRRRRRRRRMLKG